jgi:hypothetical protein
VGVRYAVRDIRATIASDVPLTLDPQLRVAGGLLGDGWQRVKDINPA